MDDPNNWSRNELVNELVDLRKENKQQKQELEKYKIAVKYFEDHGFKDIVRNLLSY